MPSVDREFDLLIPLHRADLCGEGGAGAAGKDDARHHRGHFTEHRDGDEIGVVDIRAKLLQLDRADKSENHADEKRDDADDRQRFGAAFLHHQEEIRDAEARSAGCRARQRQQCLAEESDRLTQLLALADQQFAELSDRVVRTCLLGAGAARRSCQSEIEQLSRIPRQTEIVDCNSALAAEGKQAEQEAEKGAIPLRQRRAVDLDAVDGGSLSSEPLERQ